VTGGSGGRALADTADVLVPKMHTRVLSVVIAMIEVSVEELIWKIAPPSGAIDHF
jgi:hypothetical protein